MKEMKTRLLTHTFLLAALAASPAAPAYQAGDQIDESIANSLGISSGVAVVDFFASWCVSCSKELPLLQAALPELTQSGARLVGVDTDEEISEGMAYQKSLGLTFPVFNDDKQEVVAKFNPKGMPALYFIKDRKVVKVLFGAVNHVDKVVATELKGLE